MKLKMSGFFFTVFLMFFQPISTKLGITLISEWQKMMQVTENLSKRVQ